MGKCNEAEKAAPLGESRLSVQFAIRVEPMNEGVLATLSGEFDAANATFVRERLWRRCKSLRRTYGSTSPR